MSDRNRKIGAINGLLLGIVLCIITYYIYFFDINALVSVWFGVTTIAVTIAFGCISIISVKKSNDGLITFKEAFSAYFLTLIVGSAVSCLFVIILFNFIFDAEKVSMIKKTLADFNVYIMKLNYASPADINKSIALGQKFDPSDVFQIFSSAIKYLLRDCLIGFLVALIFRNKRTL